MAKDGINIKISVDNRQGVAAVGEQARAFSNLSLHVGKARQSIASLTVAFAAGQFAFSAYATAQDASSVLLQFSQAMGSGKIGGEGGATRTAGGS